MNPENYKQIAVVGVSGDADKYGHKIFRDLLNASYPVKGINPKGGFVLGQNLYKDLEELEPKPDLVITVVHPDITEKVVEQCNTLGIKNLWMQPGSDSAKALEKAERYGINAITACFMVKEGIW